ncbi:MAG: hypothetical protein GC199_08510 [Alphaproteobacteria bacterium]|nr:hypothetical protein [Alphaproteobacteria bacterium]
MAAAVFVCAALGACSAVPDWANPGAWVGSSSSEPAPTGEYPNLSNVPERPVEGMTSGERREIEDSLIADREQARHSGEALRGGQDTPAPPPAPSTPGTPAPAAEGDAPAPEDAPVTP